MWTCTAVRETLWLGKCTGVLPVLACRRRHHRSMRVCAFRRSRFWTAISILVNIIVIIHLFLLLYGYILLPTASKNFFNSTSQMVFNLVHGFEMYVALLCGLLNAKKVCVVLNDISKLPTYIKGTEKSRKMLRIYLITHIVLVLLGFVFLVPFVHIFKEKLFVFSIVEYEKSILGLVVRVILRIIPYTQTCIVGMLCILIGIKCDELEKRMKHIFSNIISAYDKIITYKFTEINEEYNLIINNLYLINKCFGFQLLVTLSSTLFCVVYGIFRQITSEKYSLQTFYKMYNVFRISIFLLELLLYLYFGYIIKYKIYKPVNVLQTLQILHYPLDCQRQIEILLLQWTSRNGLCLSAFNIIQVGPGLIAPIVGSVITYLIIFLQYDS